MSLIGKLKARPGKTAVINSPKNILGEFKALKPAASIPAGAKQSFDFVLLFTTNSNELEPAWKRIIPTLKEDAVFWVAYPKKSSGIPSDLAGMSVLITGGTGSFGRAFVHRLLSSDPPQRLVVFSRDEQKQETMARELQQLRPDLFGRLRFFIGDVRDVSRLELAMRDVDIVIHAAALKIIPTAEYNPPISPGGT